MAFPTLGGVTFVYLNSPDRPGEEQELLAEITRPGVNSNAYLRLGTRPQLAVLIGEIDFSSASARDAQFNSFRGWVGQTKTYNPEEGNSRSLFIRSVRSVRSRRVGLSVGGVRGGSYTGLFIFEVEQRGT